MARVAWCRVVGLSARALSLLIMTDSDKRPNEYEKVENKSESGLLEGGSVEVVWTRMAAVVAPLDSWRL